ELFEISAKKVIGLTNSPEKLNELRGERLRSMGLSGGSDYADLNRILDELEYAEKIMKRIGCPIIDVSNKAIEETSELVINLLKKNGIRFDD
ncbi:MAG: kinase/pyrophosphorylase, partial [Tissierellaceae bacterium]